MESSTQINSNLLCLIENHSAISSTIGSYLHSPLLQTRYQSQQIKVCKPSKIAGAVKVPTAYKVKSGRLRPAKYISLYEYNLPLPSTLLKSPPTSSAFFTVYNTTKSKLTYHAYCENVHSYVTDVLAVYLGHTASCIVRVPVDLVKQQSRLPVNANLSVFELINQLVCSRRISEKVAYQLFCTVAREIPFCSIKFPLWEFLKMSVERSSAREIKTHESVMCGIVAGGTAAALTTPIDLAYKEVYVNKQGGQYPRLKMMYVIRDIAREDGVKGLFAGVKTRVPMVSFGALLFFGSYEQKKRFLFEEH